MSRVDIKRTGHASRCVYHCSSLPNYLVLWLHSDLSRRQIAYILLLSAAIKLKDPSLMNMVLSSESTHLK